jgi:acyl carrier protein
VSTADNARVRAIVANVFQVAEEELSSSSSPDTIETWDSPQHLNMVLALEQEFVLQFTPEEIEQMLSLELIELLVEEKLKACKVAYAD